MLLQQIFRVAGNKIKSERLDIIKDTLKEHAEHGRKKVNHQLINTYSNNLSYIANIDDRDSIIAYIHMLNDMLGYLDKDYNFADGVSTDDFIDKHIDIIQKKERFDKNYIKEQLGDILDPRIVNALGLPFQEKSIDSETNTDKQSSTESDDIFENFFSGGKKRHNKTKKRRKIQ